MIIPVSFLWLLYTPIRKVFAERKVLWQSLGGNEGTGTRIYPIFADGLFKFNDHTLITSHSPVFNLDSMSNTWGKNHSRCYHLV